VYKKTFHTSDDSNISIRIELDSEVLRIYENDKLIYKVLDENLNGNRICNLSNGSELELRICLKWFKIDVAIDGKLLKNSDNHWSERFYRLILFMSVVSYTLLSIGIFDFVAKHSFVTHQYSAVTIFCGALLLFVTNKLRENKNLKFLILFQALIITYVPFTLESDNLFEVLIVCISSVVYLFRYYKLLLSMRNNKLTSVVSELKKTHNKS